LLPGEKEPVMLTAPLLSLVLLMVGLVQLSPPVAGGVLE